MSLKLVSVNIESHKHLDKVMKLLQAEQPDVVCLQEVFQVDLPFFTEALDMEGHFLSLADIDHATNYQFDPLGIWGVAILTKLPHTEFQDAYYVRHDDKESAKIQDFEPNSVDRGVIWTTVTKDDQPFTIATTHFTWSEEGSSTELQAQNLKDLLAILQPLPELILCGDFNAPRGKATFQTLADHYTDNIPAQYTSSLDPELHRVGHLQLMVDGLFTTPHYQTKNVRLATGVSDHQAIVGEVERV
jgi:endonuclease/exonuclease/phosphatase family metal-dependent hydrolase